MFNSFQYNQSTFNSPLFITILNNYIEDLNFIISSILQEEDLVSYLDDVQINILSISKITTDIINNFLRVRLERPEFNIELKRKILNPIELERPDLSFSLGRRLTRKVSLKRIIFRINLERIGER